MDAEQRTLDAITITRAVLRKALTSPFTMAALTLWEVPPESIENQVTEMLKYLDKTKHEKVKNEWAEGVAKMWNESMPGSEKPEEAEK